MLTVTIVLALAALIAAVAAAMNRAPLWVSVIILCLLEMLRSLPLGR
jgi:uncharacterized protein (DUF983 family)